MESINRYDKPCSLDDHADGTICYVRVGKSLQCYLRVNSKWVDMGIFVSEQEFKKYLQNHVLA